MDTAPILLFTFKRLDSLEETVEALKKNKLSKESELFVFSDGPKNDKDKNEVNKVRAYLKTITGFKKVTIKESQLNNGLAHSIISGVSEIIKRTDKVIVLEDDLITTPNFLSFMNKSLEEYQHSSNVFSISGYSFNLESKTQSSNGAYFLPRGWSWGWATWKNRWQEIDWEVKDYSTFRMDKKEQRKFAKGGSDLNSMLHKQMEGSLDSWAIRWFYHQFKVKGLTLYPIYSKVYNNGFDNYATHTKGSNKRYLPKLDQDFSHEFNFPDSLEINKIYHKRFLSKMGIWARIISKLEGLFIH